MDELTLTTAVARRNAAGHLEDLRALVCGFLRFWRRDDVCAAWCWNRPHRADAASSKADHDGRRGTGACEDRGGWRLRSVPLIAQAERIAVPTVIGLLRPMILLPASALTALTANELELILAHELAHVRRFDLWVNLLQRLGEVVLFFNPAMWYLSRRISTLREYCCDELVCRRGESDGRRCDVDLRDVLCCGLWNWHGRCD